jgi:hypothetical protein
VLQVGNNQLKWLPAELSQLPKLTHVFVRLLGPLIMFLTCRHFQLQGNPLATIAVLPVEDTADNAVECARRFNEIIAATTHIGMIRERATEICIALQDLELPAFVTLTILDEAVHENSIRMWAKWELITCISASDEASTGEVHGRQPFNQPPTRLLLLSGSRTGGAHRRV